MLFVEEPVQRFRGGRSGQADERLSGGVALPRDRGRSHVLGIRHRCALGFVSRHRPLASWGGAGVGLLRRYARSRCPSQVESAGVEGGMIGAFLAFGEWGAAWRCSPSSATARCATGYRRYLGGNRIWRLRGQTGWGHGRRHWFHWRIGPQEAGRAGPRRRARATPGWEPRADRPDPIALVEEQAADRCPS
jgi:hypothetical protein